MHMHDTECKINLGIIKNKKTRRNPGFPSQILDMFSKSFRSTRFSNQYNIIRVKSELGRSSFQYRGPNIWIYLQFYK